MCKKIKILHINTWDHVGGAAQGMYILHKELQKQGVESILLVQYKTIDNDSSIVRFCDDDEALLRNNLDILPTRMYKNRKPDLMSNAIIDSAKLLNKINEISPDIVHLHWIGGGLLSIEDIAKITIPIIWTIRDWWPMTGGCHHPMDCTNYMNSCGNCPILNSLNTNDISKQNLYRKFKFYDSKNITIVGISKFMSEEAKRSSTFKDFNITTINNNIDNSTFYPINRIEAKHNLNIITNKKIVSIGSNSLLDKHKGMIYFLEAMKFLNKEDILIVFFGNTNKNILDNISYEYISLGYIKDKNILRDVYNISDVYIAPYLFEPFGKTIAESMACGTPVVCFEGAGGPSEIVTHKEDGYLAGKYDSEDLAKGILWVLDNKNYKELSLNAIKKVNNKFSAKIIAQQYINLYKSKIKNSQSQNKLIQNTDSNLYEGLNKIIEFKSLMSKVQLLPKVKYIIYGYGYMGMFIKYILKNENIIFVDQDVKKIDNLSIFHPNDFDFTKYDKVIISVLDRGEQIASYLKTLGIMQSDIIDINKLIKR